MKQLAERLKEARVSNNISQAALAAELNVKPATVSRYENDSSDPDSLTVIWYAKRFNVSTDWLYGLTDDPTPRDDVADLALAEKIAMSTPSIKITKQELAKKLPEDVRDTVLQLIDVAIEEAKIRNEKK